MILTIFDLIIVEEINFYKRKTNFWQSMAIIRPLEDVNFDMIKVAY